MMDDFEGRLTPEQQVDPRYAFRVFMVGRTANRAPNADLAVEIVPPGSEVAEKFNIALKEVEKKKYLPSELIDNEKEHRHVELQLYQSRQGPRAATCCQARLYRCGHRLRGHGGTPRKRVLFHLDLGTRASATWAKDTRGDSDRQVAGSHGASGQ
jgi:hypothetical protein